MSGMGGLVGFTGFLGMGFFDSFCGPKKERAVPRC